MIHAILLASLLSLPTPDLTQTDAFLAQDTWDRAFHTGDQTVIETKSCLPNYCDSPYDTIFNVQSVGAGEAIFQGAKMDGTPISQEAVTQADWVAMNQNRVRFEIHSLETASYQVTVGSITSSSRSVKVNGKATVLSTLVVELDGANPAGMKIVDTIEVAPGLGGMGQAVQQTFSHGTAGADTFTVVSYDRAP